jgi:hypothetical protein
MQNPIIKEAVDYLQESGFTKGELATYDKYWDDISSETTLMSAAKREGKEEVIKNAIIMGFDNEMIKTLTGLTDNEIDNLRNS